MLFIAFSYLAGLLHQLGDFRNYESLSTDLVKRNMLEFETWLPYILAGVALLLGIYFLQKNKWQEKRKKELAERWGKVNTSYLNWNLIVSYHSEKINDDECSVNEQTSKDLDFQKLFSVLNHTYSKIGQQVLYWRLFRPLKNENKLLAFDELVESLSQQEEKRLVYQVALNRLDTVQDYFFPYLLQLKELKRPKWVKWLYVSQLISGISFIGMFIFPPLALFFILMGLVNMVIHYSNKSRIANFVKAFQRFPILLSACEKMDRAYPLPNSQELRKALGRTKKIRYKLSWIAVDSLQENDPTGLAWGIVEFLKMLTITEVTTFYSLLSDMKTCHTDIEMIYQAVGNADLALSTASFRSTMPYCKPEFHEENEISFQSLRHPLVDNCIGNDLQISDKGILITGSNMSGKSTFLRSIGINVILAQTIYTCTSERFCLPFVEIYSSMRIEDNISEGASYYMQEVNTIKSLVDKSQENGSQKLFLIDELFKGTNTPERVSSSKAVLSHLQQSGSFVVVCTHDVELTQMLESEYLTFHFEEQAKENELIFDYLLKSGPPNGTNAIKILGIAQYPKELLQEAERVFTAYTKE